MRVDSDTHSHDAKCHIHMMSCHTVVLTGMAAGSFLSATTIHPVCPSVNASSFCQVMAATLIPISLQEN